MDREILKRYRWHRSRFEKASHALDYARAEARAEEDQNVRIRWEQDECPDTSWMDEGQLREFQEDRAYLLVALLEVRCGECGEWRVSDVLGGVHVGPDGSDDPYCRTIEAEMLSNHYHQAA